MVLFPAAFQYELTEGGIGMKNQFRCIERIGWHPVTGVSDGGFVSHVEQGLLLELKEAGYLTMVQYREAEDLRARRCRESMKNEK